MVICSPSNLGHGRSISSRIPQPKFSKARKIFTFDFGLKKILYDFGQAKFLSLRIFWSDHFPVESGKSFPVRIYAPTVPYNWIFIWAKIITYKILKAGHIQNHLSNGKKKCEAIIWTYYHDPGKQERRFQVCYWVGLGLVDWPGPDRLVRVLSFLLPGQNP